MVAVSVGFTSSIVKTGIELSAPSAKRVSFKIKGAGSKNTAVTIGIYFQSSCVEICPQLPESFLFFNNLENGTREGVERMYC
jgi:hypothetical protein